MNTQADWELIQFRSSVDGIKWSGWSPMLGGSTIVRTPVEHEYVQVRILMNGNWAMSPVTTLDDAGDLK